MRSTRLSNVGRRTRHAASQATNYQANRTPEQNEIEREPKR